LALFPFPRTDLSYSHSDGTAARGGTIEHGNADLDFRDLPGEVPRHEALAQSFHAMHPLTGSDLLANHERDRFDPASTVVAGQVSPQGTTQGTAQVSRRIDRFVSGDCPGARGFPRFGIFAGRDDSVSATGGNRMVAFAGIIGAIGCDRTDVLIRRDLVPQLGQQDGIADSAGGDLDSSDLQCFLVNSYVYLTP